MTGSAPGPESPFDRVRPWLVAGVLAIAAVLMFARLGHYALWDDEANTALSAQGVLRTGDTTAWVSDHNLLAYDRGAELANLHLRYIPPLQAYVAAPSLWLFGPTAWAARWPFAVCGLAAVALMLAWLWRAGAGGRLWLLMALGILGNASLFLYARNSRYYALALLSSVAIAYCYAQRGRLRAWAPWMAFASVALLAANYLNYAALYACLAADYAIWGRRERPLAGRDWITLLLPQIVAAALIVPVWNPLMRDVGADPATLADRLTLLYAFAYDLNRCEFAAVPLLLLAPLLARRNPWLGRASLAVAVYLVVITLAVPWTQGLLIVAPVRYLVPLIPLVIFIQAALLAALTRRSAWIALLAGLLVFGTNLVHGGPLRGERVQYTMVSYVRELLHPPPDPYRAASNWINANVGTGESVWVVPSNMTYPLMFHAPHAVYAGQLAWPPAQPQFEGLPDIHYWTRGPITSSPSAPRASGCSGTDSPTAPNGSPRSASTGRTGTGPR